MRRCENVQAWENFLNFFFNLTCKFRSLNGNHQLAIFFVFIITLKRLLKGLIKKNLQELLKIFFHFLKFNYSLLFFYLSTFAQFMTQMAASHRGFSVVIQIHTEIMISVWTACESMLILRRILEENFVWLTFNQKSRNQWNILIFWGD